MKLGIWLFDLKTRHLKRPSSLEVWYHIIITAVCVNPLLNNRTE